MGLIGAGRNRHGYLDRVDEVRELSIPEMSQSQLSTFLTWVPRGERFCDGFIAEFVDEGSVLQALQRAVALGNGARQGAWGLKTETPRRRRPGVSSVFRLCFSLFREVPSSSPRAPRTARY